MRFPKTLALACALAFALTPALAGPPLVCWKVETDGGASLPWVENKHSFDGTSAEYDTSGLAADATALLGPEVPVLARMETLRRAALYAVKDGGAGRALLSRLVARAKAAPQDPLARFDAGYFAATWEQAGDGLLTEALRTVGLKDRPSEALGGGTPYDWVKRALTASRDPQMEYAAALISWHPQRPEHDGHLSRAAAGATPSSALERNLLKHFAHRGRTLAELRAIRS